MPKRSRSKPAPEKGQCCGPECCGSDSHCCGTPAPGACQVEAIVRMDARGQLVVPKDVRQKAGFQANRKLALVSWKRGGATCCVTLQPLDEITEAVRRAYGPILSELVGR